MADERKHDPYCEPCFYYARNTRSCDYFIVEDRLRGCPGGNGCKARLLKKDVKKRMGKPRWDTEQGRQMYLQGMNDQQIGDHFGVAANTVLYQRQKYWEKDAGSTPPVDNTAPVCVKEEVKEEMKQETAIPTAPTGSKKPPEIYEVLEEATGNMQGIKAICTAEAILQLWKWESKEDLLKARAAIDYLIKKLEDKK